MSSPQVVIARGASYGGEEQSKGFAMASLRASSLAILFTCLATTVGTLPLAAAQDVAPQFPSSQTAVERALAEITPTDWSVQSAAQLVQRVLDQATSAQLEAAADAGDYKAQTILAMANDFGLAGYAQDKAEAVRLYTLSANQGFAAAQEYLAGHYELGDGVARDTSEAIRLHRLAAEQSYPRAQINLGFLYVQGTSVAQNYPEAMRLFRLAADSGNQHGMRNVGMMFERGLGVREDLGQAIRWYRRAAQLGFEPAQNDLRRLGVGWSPQGDL